MADTEVGQETCVKNVRITRGENAEVDLDIESVEDIYVFDELGNKIRFGDLYKRKKSIIIFVRHFLCYMCKDYVEDLSLVPEDELKAAKTQLVVIGCAPWKSIKAFRRETGYKHEMYCDPDRQIYKKLGFREDKAQGNPKESKHVKSGMIVGMMKSTWRAMQAGDWLGDPSQQGGAIVLAVGGEIIFSHMDKTASDHIPINTLLKAADIPEVSFPNDGRVIHV